MSERPDRLWVQHHNGIFRSDDGSASWREIENVPPSSFGFAVAVHPREPDTAWFVPAIKDERRIPVDGKLVVTRTRDGAATFDVLRAGLPQDHAYDASREGEATVADLAIFCLRRGRCDDVRQQRSLNAD